MNLLVYFDTRIYQCIILIKYYNGVNILYAKYKIVIKCLIESTFRNCKCQDNHNCYKYLYSLESLIREK